MTSRRGLGDEDPPVRTPASASRLSGIEISLIRQINALATPFSANLGIGEPNLEPDERLREMAGRAAAARWSYTPNAGTLPLRTLVAAGTPFDPAGEVCITAGTEEALYAIFQAFVDPGDEVLVPDPGFVSYPTLAKLAGATPLTYDLDAPSWALDAGALASRITQKTKLIVVNSPSNPLGSVADEGALRSIAELAEERGCLVVSDEVYREIWYEAPPVTMTGMGRNTIVVGGMSKSHGLTGLRIGWAMAQAELMKPIVTAHQYIATCASSFSQALAESILSDQEWNRGWLDDVRNQFTRQREAALHAVEKEIGHVQPPQGAFYVFAPVPACNTLEFARQLATDAAVLAVPGSAFGRNGEGFIRISYAAPVDAIGTGIERIGRFLRSIGR